MAEKTLVVKPGRKKRRKISIISLICIQIKYIVYIGTVIKILSFYNIGSL